jgi:hypothetical protein
MLRYAAAMGAAIADMQQCSPLVAQLRMSAVSDAVRDVLRFWALCLVLSVLSYGS